MGQKSKSPRIANITWGRMEIEGKDRVIKDAKLYPGGVRESRLTSKNSIINQIFPAPETHAIRSTSR